MERSPLTDIEDKQGHHDTGVTAARIYQAALEESKSSEIANAVLISYFAGMFYGVVMANKDNPLADSPGDSA